MCTKWNKTACDAGTTATSWFIIGQYIANKISLPQGQSYTERKYFLGAVKKYFLSVKLWPWGKLIIGLYKITKIVCALWLADRRVCMRVCKHGCGVKMFCFSRAIHAIKNLETFLSWKLHTFTLFIPMPSSAETWKIFRKMLCQFFFSLNLTL